MSRKREPLTFTAGVTLTDGREIYVSLTVPHGHETAPGRWVGENAEIAQLAANNALANWRRGDASRRGETDVPF